MLHPVRSQPDDFSRTEEIRCFVTEVGESSAFGAYGHGIFFLSNDNRSPAPGITGCDDAVFGQDQHRAGTFYFPEYILDTFHEILPPYDQQAYEFGDVDLSAAELREIHSFVQESLAECFRIVDFRYGNQCESSQMGVDQHRLGICVTDHSDSGVPGEFPEFVFESAAEVSVFKAVDPSEESFFRVVGGKSAAAGPQVAVVVSAVE